MMPYQEKQITDLLLIIDFNYEYSAFRLRQNGPNNRKDC